MDNDYLIFLVMVFLAFSLMVGAFSTPIFGENARLTKRLRERIRDVIGSLDEEAVSLLQQQDQSNQSKLGQLLEQIPHMDNLTLLVAQSGWKVPAHKLLTGIVAGSIIIGVGIMLLMHEPLIGLAAASVVFISPLWVLQYKRTQRIEQVDEQLADTLEYICRAVRAGHPLLEAMRLVAGEGKDPIATEFGKTLTDITYGMSQKEAFYRLLERVPSINLMAMVTVILIQRETGGNPIEILEKIAAIIRSRYMFQRKIRAFSADARLSGRVLILIPFLLTILISITSPNYLPILTEDPLGRKLIGVAFFTMLVGILWMRHIARIKV